MGNNSPSSLSVDVNQADPWLPYRLPRSFYARDTRIVARELLGKLLVRRTETVTQIGRIVETEAYLGEGDMAAHTARGKTPRTEVMFGPAGFLYIYLIYGIHHMLNIVTETEGKGTAVLVRALEPVQHVSNTHGPGRLCKALGIDRSHYGLDLCGDQIYVARPAQADDFTIVSAPRVGVDFAGKEWAGKPLRFYIEGNRHVSVR